MALHTFIGVNPINAGRVFYGNAAPTAVDGNTYIIGDFIQYLPFPIGTAITLTSPPAGWWCTLGGAGGTATWSQIGGGSQASATQFKHVYTEAGAPLVTTTGTDTAGIATVTWVNEIFIPCSMTVTGISYLIGSVGGTDKVVVILFSSAGAILANSILDSSVTVGTTATMQRVPFTAPLAVLGPGKYYVGVSTNGTTAKIRTQAFGDNDAGQITGGTFNTLVAITPPATFTASQGPVAMLY